MSEEKKPKPSCPLKEAMAILVEQHFKEHPGQVIFTDDILKKVNGLSQKEIDDLLRGPDVGDYYVPQS